MNAASFGLIILGITLNTIAQLCLKQGMNAIGAVSLDMVAQNRLYDEHKRGLC